MQNRVSLGGHLTASLWTTLIAGALVAVSCSWITFTSLSAQAADPNNILLDFSAKWCGPCQQMSPIVAKLERQGYPIRQVDVDQEGALSKKYKVESIPCFVLIANGKEISRITGACEEKQLKKMMSMLPKPDSDVEVASSSTDKKRRSTSDQVASSKSSEDKKGLLAIPPLFPKRKKDVQQQPKDESEIVRGQGPDVQSKDTEFGRDAMAASTRIRVKDGTHVHFGSGTVIDSQPGRAIILTCGHILRKLGKNAVIEVDLFSERNSKPTTMTAKALQADMAADVGLLEVACQQQLPVVKLALSRELPKAKDKVFSIGCGGGNLPSVEEHVITAINGVDGPDNLECTGVPLQGRSGGGLFMGPEQIGVCILADANLKRGIYTGMKPVAQLLQAARLTHLLPSSPTNDQKDHDLVADTDTVDSSDHAETDAAARHDDLLSNMLAEVPQTSSSANNTPLLAAAEYEGAEIVCTIHPKTPGGVTRVVIINQASSRILNDLLHESGGHARADASATVQTAPVKKSVVAKQKTNSTVAAAPSPTQQRSVSRKSFGEHDRPIETSFEAKRYRRNQE